MMNRLDQFDRLVEAQLHLNHSRDAILNTLTLIGAGLSASVYEAQIHSFFCKAADVLGYDLVKRTDAAAQTDLEAA